MKKLALFVIALASINSFADQCAYVTKDSATTAVKLISLSKKNAGGVLALCKSCGEKEAKQIKVNQIDIGETGVSNVPSEVAINGEGIDLAYTYVNISAGTWVNLGKLSNCEVHDESQFILEKKSANGKVKFVASPVF